MDWKKIAEDRGFRCAVKVELLQVYTDAVLAWSRLRETGKPGVLKRAAHLHEDAIKAKAEYENHRAEHGC